MPVKVLTVYRDEVEVNAARPGENLRLRLQGIEEEDISAGGRRVCVWFGWAWHGGYLANEYMQAGSISRTSTRLHGSNFDPPAHSLQALCCATASAWCPR